MADFQLEIVAPEGSVLSESVQFAVLPTTDGEIGILANHASLISALKVGVIRYTQDNVVKKISTSGGFVEVSNNRVVVLADTAEHGEMIDLERAIAAKERAEKRLAERKADLDISRAELALQKALNRIKAAQK